jgi:ribosomal protein S27AE
MTRRVKFVLAMALAAVVTLVCLEYLRTPEGLPRSQRLADGSVLTVESISIGTNHYYHEASPRDWQLAVGKRLPYTLAAGLGWCFDTSGEAISVSNPRMTSLVIFAKDRARAPPTPSELLFSMRTATASVGTMAAATWGHTTRKAPITTNCGSGTFPRFHAEAKHWSCGFSRSKETAMLTCRSCSSTSPIRSQGLIRFGSPSRGPRLRRPAI